MKSEVFNTVFESMLRVLLLTSILDDQANSDRITALDFICIFGRKCEILDRDLHGDNEFCFAEYAVKRERIAEAIRLAVRNDFLEVVATDGGFRYSINERGRRVVSGVDSPYARAYLLGARIVCRRFANCPDDEVLRYVDERAMRSLGVQA